MLKNVRCLLLALAVLLSGLALAPYVKLGSDQFNWRTFAQAYISYTITPSAGPNGTIAPSTPQTVAQGSSITFTIAANPGSIIRDVLVDGVSKGPISSYTFSNVVADHTIAATFSYVSFLPFILK